jgi:hypothetical protein
MTTVAPFAPQLRGSKAPADGLLTGVPVLLGALFQQLPSTTVS